MIKLTDKDIQKEFKTRNGNKVLIHCFIEHNEIYPFGGKTIEEEPMYLNWNENGRVFYSEECDWDLVERL